MTNYPETFVQKIWQHQLLRLDELRLTNGRKVHVQFPGRWNSDDGPDFLDAELRIGQVEVTGDVEIHLTPYAWQEHQHDQDPRYNRVILHVVLWDDDYVPDLRRQDGRILSTLVLSDFLSEPLGKLISILEYESPTTFPCRSLDPDRLAAIIDTAGEKRWQVKVQTFLRRIGVLTWEDVLYEGIMEGLGYAKNRWQFMELAQQVPLKVIRRCCKDALDVQALLFGTAGLLPPPDSTHEDDGQPYVNILYERWNQLRQHHPTTPLEREFWQFGSMRPSNYPTVRLGAMAHLLDRHRSCDLFVTIQHIFDTITPGRAALADLHRHLNDFFAVPKEDYWTTHYTFYGKRHTPVQHLIGKQRQRVLIINIFLPILSAWAQVNGDRARQDTLEWLYQHHPSLGKNHIVHYQLDQTHADPREFRSAKREQGLIYVYKQTCFRLNCTHCILNP
ncbi:MAG: DUF2851 family protein [Gemmatimonadetes bacterium]|nr:MAG: DUF2851 family protein [Gemmatimonadota bacterium]